MIHKSTVLVGRDPKRNADLSLQDMDILTGETDFANITGGIADSNWIIDNQMNEGSAFHPVPVVMVHVLTFFADLRVEG